MYKKKNLDLPTLNYLSTLFVFQSYFSISAYNLGLVAFVIGFPISEFSMNSTLFQTFRNFVEDAM